MKITKDSKGAVILNNGRHRVILSAELVQAIVGQVYAEAPPAESEGRMVVVDLGDVAAGESEAILLPVSFEVGSNIPALEDFKLPVRSLEERRAMVDWLTQETQDLGFGYGEEDAEGDGDHATSYGAFPGGDPRLFDPDSELSTPEELEAHRKACEEAQAMEERGEVPDWPSAHTFGQVGDVGVHVERSMFGLGRYEYEEVGNEERADVRSA